MDLRATELAAKRLERSRQFFIHALALAVVTLGAMALTVVWAPIAAVPLAALAAIEALVLMWAHYVHRDLLQQLLLEPHSVRIAAVEEYRVRILAQQARDRLAASINSLIADARLPYAICLADRVALVEDQLRWLARELSTPEVLVQTPSLVACLRLMTHGAESPLFNPAVPVEQLQSTLLRIRFGFSRTVVG